jgi:hypothetical protein
MPTGQGGVDIVNIAQINGVTPAMGTGALSTGTSRVTLATDDPGVVSLASIASTSAAGADIGNDQVKTKKLDTLVIFPAVTAATAVSSTVSPGDIVLASYEVLSWPNFTVWVKNAGGGAGGIKFRSSAAVDVSSYIWGTHQENGKYSTSYIKTTTGVGTTNTDSIYYQPFLNTGITGIGYGYKYKKIIFELDANPLWSVASNASVASSYFFRFITTSPSQVIVFYFDNASNFYLQTRTYDLTDKTHATNFLGLIGNHKYKVVLDLTDSTNCKIYKDGVDMGGTMTAFTNKYISIDATTGFYVGAYSTSAQANAGIRNFKMWLET